MRGGPRTRRWLDAHRSAPIDEEVWLTREDVVAGRVTVVAAAIDWIRRKASRTE